MSKLEYKRCRCCGETKSLLKFHKNGAGRRNVCAVCRNINGISYNKSPKRIYEVYKRSATRRGFCFDISMEDFCSFEDSSCNYCGSRLEKIMLDRVDNKAGYNMSNVVPCCTRCNFFKHTLEKEEFLEHVSKIYLYQKEE